MARRLELRVSPPGDALDRFEAAWNRIAEGGKPKPLEVLSVEDLPLLIKTLTPARWALVQRLAAEGPLSIYELAKRLARDYKNVYTDVKALAQLRLVAQRADSLVEVPWDAVRAELRL